MFKIVPKYPRSTSRKRFLLCFVQLYDQEKAKYFSGFTQIRVCLKLKGHHLPSANCVPNSQMSNSRALTHSATPSQNAVTWVLLTLIFPDKETNTQRGCNVAKTEWWGGTHNDRQTKEKKRLAGPGEWRNVVETKGQRTLERRELYCVAVVFCPGAPPMPHGHAGWLVGSKSHLQLLV